MAGIATAAGAANAVPVAGQVASAALAVGLGLMKVFTGRAEKKKNRARGRRAAVAAEGQRAAEQNIRGGGAVQASGDVPTYASTTMSPHNQQSPYQGQADVVQSQSPGVQQPMGYKPFEGQ